MCIRDRVNPQAFHTWTAHVGNGLDGVLVPALQGGVVKLVIICLLYTSGRADAPLCHVLLALDFDAPNRVRLEAGGDQLLNGIPVSYTHLDVYKRQA